MPHPLIITCPVVGAELTRDIYPHLPLTPDEIADSAAGAVNAGTSIIHLHVRDEKGRPSQRMDIFELVTKKIRERCDCIIQYSTGGAVGTPVAERCAPLKLRPEMATLSMGTLNFGSDIFENSENTIRQIAQAIQDNGVMAELEIFDLGMMDTVERFLAKNYIPSKFHIDFVLGVPGGLGGTVENLLYFLRRLPPEQTWSVAGIGRTQLPLAMHAIALGGNVRIGLEDNFYFRKGEMALSNAQLVERVAQISRLYDRPVANVSQTRQMLGLRQP
jgi:3-keto-5-aminohexanoate cleavage enzyme